MDTTQTTWTTWRARTALQENEIHLWRIPLDQPAHVSNHLKTTLSLDEMQRANRFYTQQLRDQWTIARGSLRRLLSLYLEVKPEDIRFSTNEYGKPAIERPAHGQRLQFNLSHSADIALYAFMYDRSIGVDVEQMRVDVDYEAVAQYHFSPVENQILCTIPQKKRLQAFYHCWTRKEAYIKARGAGLAISLDQFDVSFQPERPAALLASREDPYEVARWSFRDIQAGARYAGALVVEGRIEGLKCWQEAGHYWS